MRVVARRSGQVATEILTVVSVVVVAVVITGHAYVPQLTAGVASLGSRVERLLDAGQIGGIGHNDKGGTANGGGAHRPN